MEQGNSHRQRWRRSAQQLIGAEAERTAAKGEGDGAERRSAAYRLNGREERRAQVERTNGRSVVPQLIGEEKARSLVAGELGKRGWPENWVREEQKGVAAAVRVSVL
ncbi:tagaturonate reductase [Sesbania bispinosa]|nr:tagaturonate reductase [Sesbania bispinosa]